MIFGYPAEATVENWFHECLIQILQSVHHCVEAGEKVPAWPDIIPEPYRHKLSSRTGIKDRLDVYVAAIRKLNIDELHLVSRTLIDQNEIERLLSAECDCETIHSMPLVVQEPIKNLFDFGFKLLTDLGVRDRQYKIIYDSLPAHVCPFCGCEMFDAPGAPRVDLDHYLAKNEYPFAAVNLRNLVPMGTKCNERYKREKNILYRKDKTRRKSFFPYGFMNRSIKVSLLRSRPFEGTNELVPLPLWKIDFVPDSEEVITWDEVFDIRTRYKRDILDKEFITMLREFSAYCKSRKIRPVSRDEIIQALNDFCDYWSEIGMKDRAFIKAAVFEMLYQQCRTGNQRLSDMIIYSVIGGMDLG